MAESWWLNEDDEMKVLRGVVYMVKNIGLSTDSWGTPKVRRMCSDEEPETFTEKVRDDRYDLKPVTCKKI